MKLETIVIGIIIILVASAIAFLMVFFTMDEYCQEGIVTDKYILPRFTGEAIYYIVLDNETDVKTFENFYYKYEVGDYYNPCNR